MPLGMFPTHESEKTIKAVLAALDGGMPVHLVAAKHGLTPSRISQIRVQHRGYLCQARGHRYHEQLVDRETLAFIVTYTNATGDVSPSFAEIADAVSLKSKATVSRVLDRLQASGKIRRLPGRHHALQVLQPLRESYYIVVKDEHDEAKLVPMERA